MARVILSILAEDDANKIAQYIFDQSGRLQARKVLKKIETAIQTIGVHPFIGRTRDEVRSGLRSYTTRPYVIFYRVDDDEVRIVRIYHSSRNLNPKDFKE